MPRVAHVCRAICHALISAADFLKILTFSKIPLVLNSFDLNQARHSDRPDLCPDYKRKSHFLLFKGESIFAKIVLLMLKER